MGIVGKRVGDKRRVDEEMGWENWKVDGENGERVKRR